MTKGQIITALQMHGIRHHIAADGRVWAEELATVKDPSTGEVVSADAWVHAPTTVSDMYDWLGY